MADALDSESSIYCRCEGSTPFLGIFSFFELIKSQFQTIYTPSLAVLRSRQIFANQHGHLDETKFPFTSLPSR